jgi:HPt (histidine-containing phosphotransfer) domain-containing protein
MTAHALEGDRETCLAAGMDDYISKPVDIEELASKLKQWCGANVVSAKKSHEGQLELYKSSNGQSGNGSEPAKSPAESLTDAPSIDSVVIEKLRAIDPDNELGLLDRLIDIFFCDTPKKIEMLRESIDRVDLDSAIQAAHALRGSSANLGARNLSNMCAYIEHRGYEGSFDKVKGIFAEVEKEFERVINALELERTKT